MIFKPYKDKSGAATTRCKHNINSLSCCFTVATLYFINLPGSEAGGRAFESRRVRHFLYTPYY